jgi:type I restriction enzyme S subunit
MKNWPKQPLGELTLPVEQRDPRKNPADEFSYVDIAGVDNQAKAIVTINRIVGAKAPSRARKIIREGDVIVSMVRPNLNAVARVQSDLDNEICSTGFSVLRPSSKIMSRYLFAFTRSPIFIDYLVARTTGANYPAVNDGEVKAALIPVPPLAEQERIVKVLDEADESRKLRAKADKRTAELIPALFYEIFGDLIGNLRGWPIGGLSWPSKQLGDVLAISRERIEPREHSDTTFNYIGLESIEGHSGRLLSYKATLGAEIRSMKNVFHRGEVLYGKLRPYLNKVHLATEDGICSTDIYVLRTRQAQIDPSFVANYLRSPPVLSMVTSSMAGTNLPRISQDSLLGIPVPVPPIESQQYFADRVAQIQTMASAQCVSARHLDALFQSMLHRAFAGEL